MHMDGAAADWSDGAGLRWECGPGSAAVPRERQQTMRAEFLSAMSDEDQREEEEEERKRGRERDEERS